MKGNLAIVSAAVVLAVASAVAYQAAARERDYRALLARGEAGLRDDQTFVAIEAYSGAIALRPDSMLAHLRRGETYERRNELDEAVRDFRAAAALDPTAPRALESVGDALYLLQRYDRAADSYAAALRLDNRAADIGYKLALAFYRAGQIDRAVQAVDRALRLDTPTAQAAYLFGLCLHEAHRDRDAIRWLERAVQLSPDLILAREELGDLYAAAGRPADHLDQLRQIALRQPADVGRQIALALAQAHAGNEASAVATLGAALHSAVDRPEEQSAIYGALGTIWLERAQASGDRVYLAKAVEALRRGAAGPTASSELLTAYGRALLLAGQIDLAERTLKEASTRFPVDPSALDLYAAAAERQGHLEAARQALIDDTALQPDDAKGASIARRIAALSAQLHDPQTAALWLDHATALVPHDVHVLVDLARAELRAHNATGARLAIARGLAEDPTNQELLALRVR
jgi:tetratricopeptide (TPR) repeat protein